MISLETLVLWEIAPMRQSVRTMSEVVILDVTRVFADQPALARAAGEVEDAVVWVAHRDGGLRLINPTIHRWTGLPTYSAVGVGWLKAVHPSHRDHCYGTLLTALRESQPWSLNFSFLDAGGVPFWVIAGARCVVDPASRRLLGAVGACVRMDGPEPFSRLSTVLNQFPGRAAFLSREGHDAGPAPSVCVSERPSSTST